MASSSRARRSSLHSPTARSASLRPSVSAFQTKVHAPGVAPQAIEHVVLAGLLVEHVDDDLDVVQQHPAPSRAPLDVPGALALLAELVLDRLGNRLDLHLARGRADEEVVADAVEVAQVERDQVDRL